MNGINLVPGTVALANESGQNSAALKNITINTGSTKFNTAIEYDTDVNNTAYSRVKHYINNGKAYSYSYDEAGNIKKITNPDGSYVEYTYDSLNQLKKEIYSAALPFASLVEGGGTANAVTEGVSYDTIEYSYDTRGNITAKTFLLGDTTVANVPYTYNDTTWKDRMTSYNGNAITYDAIGNPLNWRNDFTFTWQNGRELASAENTSTSVTYTYNQNGIRTSKTVNGVKTTYVLDENDLLMGEITGENTIVYLYDENNSIYGFAYNGTPYFYLFNGQGDVMNIVDETGTVDATYNYDAWGKVITATGDMASINPIRYRGYYYDAETELYYLQSRYYDAVVGRFLNADGTGYLGVTGTVLGYNLFAYCENNPINYIDPYGMFSVPRAVVSFAIDAIIWAIFSAGASAFAFLTQPVKAIARSAGKALIKSKMRGILIGFSNKLATAIIKVSSYLVPVIKKAAGWAFKGLVGKLTATKIANTIAGGIVSLTTNSFLEVIANNITVFLSVGGLIAGLWDRYSDGSLNGWIKIC